MLAPISWRVPPRHYGRVAYVSLSDADRDPDLSYAATVYHGIDLSDFTFRDGPGRRLVFLGRIHPDKGVADAIAVAEAVGLPLVIAGIVHDREYFDREIAPHLDGEAVRYVGPIGPRDRDALLGSAVALLHLVEFPEPFGLSMIEAMACGTPVIARRRGSVPEVVGEGITGFVVDDVAGAIQAVGRVGALDRRVIRVGGAGRLGGDWKWGMLLRL